MATDIPLLREHCQPYFSLTKGTRRGVCLSNIPLMGNSLKTLRNQKGWTLDQAADAMAMSRGGYIKLERGENQLTTETINRAASVFEVAPAIILSAASSEVTVVGRIGAGAEILPDFDQTDPDGLFTVETVLNLPPDAIAFEVEGDSMFPRYDPGDIIICLSGGVAPGEVVGWYGAVQTEDGKRYLKRVLKGSTDGTFDLESHNAPTLRGVYLKWMSPVFAVIPVQQWKRLDGKARDKLLKKVAKKISR